MLGVIFLPFYILFNIYLNSLIMRLLSLFTKLGSNSYIKYTLLITQLFLSLTLFIAMFIPNGHIKRILNITPNDN